MREIIINANDAGQRLDKFLTKALKNIPLSLVYKAIRTKKIKVNRRRAAPGDMLAEGDVITLFLPDEFFQSPERSAEALTSVVPRLDIVYEDENILLLNKRPGVLVHEDSDESGNTLISHVKAYLYRKGEYDAASEHSFAPALCNRIDRNTGGIVIAAKNAAALRLMNDKIKHDKVRKYYLTAVHGRMPKRADTLTGYLRKDSARNTVEVFDRPAPGAKSIVTKYRVLAVKGDTSLLEIDLVTGRTHQIRAHLAHIGHPLLGDGKYGINRADRARGYKHQALYAYRLRFDFGKSEADALSYLDGKSFAIDTGDVWFLREFDLSGTKLF